MRSEDIQRFVVERTYSDTGERENVLGRPARHFVTKIRRIPKGTDVPIAEEIIDAWYIEFEAPDECGPESFFAHPTALANSVEPRLSDHYELIEKGSKPVGIPVKLKSTTRTVYRYPGKAPEEIVTVIFREIVEITETPLDEGLFKAPIGFTRVRDLSD